jgi:hypothetical protein
VKFGPFALLGSCFSSFSVFVSFLAPKSKSSVFIFFFASASADGCMNYVFSSLFNAKAEHLSFTGKKEDP